MKTVRNLLVSALMAAALAAPVSDASAHNIPPHMRVLMLYGSWDAAPAGEPTEVQAGQVLAIAGDCLDDPESDVSVVLALADPQDSDELGFHEMLVTAQARDDGLLKMRVPEITETRNHVFRVRLFVGHEDRRVCEAGSIRIV